MSSVTVHIDLRLDFCMLIDTDMTDALILTPKQQQKKKKKKGKGKKKKKKRKCHLSTTQQKKATWHF